MITGAVFYLIAKLLPKRYWKTADDLLDEEIRKGHKRKETI